MNIHEYQAKDLFRQYSIPVPDGGPAFSPQEAQDIAEKFGTFPVAVKAQIHAGGRGKGGGVKLASSIDEVKSFASEMLGMTLVTHQTGAKGKIVNKLLIEQGQDIADELYLSIIPDRATATLVIMASTEGGVNIEEVAEETPEKIVKVGINPLLGLQPYHCRQLAFGLNLPKELIKSFNLMVSNLFELFLRCDCSLVEINPLIITEDQRLVALDGKINFDDSALYRQKDIAAMHDPFEDEPLEVEAAKHGLNYIKLDGNIGNMVNGAGLAMATMDMIMMAGAEPANFLDVGGGANAEMVKNGFQIILSDPNVKGILVNIFGGILRCDVLAEGIVKAATETNIKVPVVVRMEGTNVEEGRKILMDSGLNLITAADLKDAALKVADVISGDGQ